MNDNSDIIQGLYGWLFILLYPKSERLMSNIKFYLVFILYPLVIVWYNVNKFMIRYSIYICR